MKNQEAVRTLQHHRNWIAGATTRQQEPEKVEEALNHAIKILSEIGWVFESNNPKPKFTCLQTCSKEGKAKGFCKCE